MKKCIELISTKTKFKCTGVILLALVSSVLASVWPVSLGEIYAEISNGRIGSIAQGIYCIGLFGLIYVAAECITIVRRVAMDCIIASHEAEIREISIEKLLKMPISYYSNRLNGETAAQLDQGVNGLSQLIKIFCNDILATFLIAICTLVQVVINAPAKMAVWMIGYLVAAISISIIQIRSQNGIREKIIAQKSKFEGKINQSLSNLELIRSMNAEEYEKLRLKPSVDTISITEKKHHKSMGKYDCAKQVLKIVFQISILLLSVVSIAEGQMAPEKVITVCLLFQQLIKPLDEIYRFMDEIASSIVKIKMLTEITSKGIDPVFFIEDSFEESSDSNILIKDVVIKNPEKKKTLAYYDNLCIPGDEIVLISGKSGTGKTVLSHCLNRYYPYTSGNIKLFGNDINTYSQHELTRCLFYVPQKAYFFAGTIQENLIYGIDREITETEMMDALRKACLLDVLISKVNGKSGDRENINSILSYQIEEGGIGLSGGEGQRLAIARAFLRAPKVYIFDESVANIDAVTADKILGNIEEYAKEHNSGIIYISHDENVVKRCSKIIYLDNKAKVILEQKEAA